MSKDFKNRLRALRTTERLIKPDEAWVRDTRSTLLMQVKNTMPTQSMSFAGRMKEVSRYVSVSRLSRAVGRPVMALLSVLTIAMGSSIFTVSAAESSLPGDFFYGIKLVSEQARLAFASSKDEKIKLKSEFTGRRVSELQQIVSGTAKQGQVAQVTETLKRDLNTLKQQLGEVQNESTTDKAIEAAKMVDQQTNNVINILQETKSQLSPESVEKLTEVQSVAADAGIKAIEVLAIKHQESSDNIPASELARSIQDHAKAVADATNVPLSLPGATSTASSTAFLIASVATSSPAITTSTLPGLVSQVKDLTEQAFALQITQDQLEIVADALAQAATGTSAGSSDTATASGTAGTTTTNSTQTGTSTPITSTSSGSSP